MESRAQVRAWPPVCLQSEKKECEALARWLSWLECSPLNQKDTGSIPGQGIERLGGGFGSRPRCE